MASSFFSEKSPDAEVRREVIVSRASPSGDSAAASSSEVYNFDAW